MILDPTGIQHLKSQPAIKSIMKVFFKEKPPKTPQILTWDVQKVLDMLKSWGKPKDLDYTKLTLRLTFLLAMAVKRPSDLALLDINHMVKSSGKYTFQPVFGAKTARTSHPFAPVLELQRAPGEPELCPYGNVKEYLKRNSTEERKPRGTRLLVTRLKGPAKNATPQMIGQWLGETVQLSGQGRNGTSVRSAAASTAYAKGVSIEKIMEAGDWALSKTPYRHYIKNLSAEASKKLILQKDSVMAKNLGLTQ